MTMTLDKTGISYYYDYFKSKEVRFIILFRSIEKDVCLLWNVCFTGINFDYSSADANQLKSSVHLEIKSDADDVTIKSIEKSNRYGRRISHRSETRDGGNGGGLPVRANDESSMCWLLEKCVTARSH